MGKLTLNVAIFNSYVYVYQRVSLHQEIWRIFELASSSSGSEPVPMADPADRPRPADRALLGRVWWGEGMYTMWGPRPR